MNSITHAAGIRQARMARVRMIRRRVVAGALALFVASWLLITVVLLRGNDPALTSHAASTVASAAPTTTSGSALTTGASGSTGSSGTAVGNSASGSANSGSSTPSSGSSSSGVSPLTSSQS